MRRYADGSSSWQFKGTAEWCHQVNKTYLTVTGVALASTWGESIFVKRWQPV